MSDPLRFRLQAVRLLDLASKAQNEGDREYAGQLTARAADYLDRAITAEASGTGVGNVCSLPNASNIRRDTVL
jgi:hypothetical protein